MNIAIPNRTSTAKIAAILALRRTANVVSLGGRFPVPQSILRRLFKHVHGVIRVEDFDGDLSMDLSLSEHMQRRIFWMGYYNKDIVPLLDRVLRPGMTFIDVGANIGEIALTAAKRVGQSGRVLAFEAIDAIADKLCTNISRNNLEQITVVRAGLADRTEAQVPIYASCGQGTPGDEHAGLGSLFGARSGGTKLEEISLTTLDTWASSNQLTAVDFMKIDIEGAELPCLKGAERTLAEYRPRLIIEVQDETAKTAGYQARDILDFLVARGYRFETIGHDGRLSSLTVDTLRDYQNVLCTPR